MKQVELERGSRSVHHGRKDAQHRAQFTQCARSWKDVQRAVRTMCTTVGKTCNMQRVVHAVCTTVGKTRNMQRAVRTVCATVGVACNMQRVVHTIRTAVEVPRNAANNFCAEITPYQSAAFCLTPSPHTGNNSNTTMTTTLCLPLLVVILSGFFMHPMM